MLSQNHFYWEMVKKYIVAFHHIFNDVHVLRRDKNGQLLKDITVPCSYVGKSKMFYLLQRDEDIGGRISTVLPRMSFLITGLTPDVARKEAATNTIPISYNFGGAEDTESIMYNPVPYNFQVQFSIWAEYQDDMMQIIEQVGTFFRPDHTFFVEEIEELDIRRNISIVLNAMNLDITNEFEDETDRMITADVDFTIKGYLYPPIKDESIIKVINVRFTDFENRCLDLANINHTFNEICAINKEAEGAMASAASVEFDTETNADGAAIFESRTGIQTELSSDVEPEAFTTYFDPAESHPSALTFSGALNDVVTHNGGISSACAVAGPHGEPGGRYYYEMQWQSQQGAVFLGVGNESSDFTLDVFLWQVGWSWRDTNGERHANGSFLGNYGNPGEFFDNAGDIVMVALDLTAMTGVGGGLMYVGTNGTWAAGSNPIGSVNPIFSDLSGTEIRPCVNPSAGGDQWQIFIKDTEWSYTAPAGYDVLLP